MGVGTQGWPSSTAAGESSSCVQTPIPHPIPSQERRKELAHSGDGSKGQEKATVSISLGVTPGPGFRAPARTHSLAAIGHEDTCPPHLVPTAEGGPELEQRAEPAREKGRQSQAQGPGRTRAGGQRLFGQPRCPSSFSLQAPQLLRGGQGWTHPRGRWVGMKWTPLDPALGQSFPPGPRGQALAAHTTARGQDSTGNSLEGRPQGTRDPSPRGLNLPGGRPAS